VTGKMRSGAPGDPAPPMPTEDSDGMIKQMSGHEEGSPESGTYAFYDPVHRRALGFMGFGEDWGADSFLTNVTPPPSTIAWRDLSHYNPGGRRIIGLSRDEVEAKYGRVRSVSACGMDSITYRGLERIATFIFQGGKVTAYISMSP
jgi:hypothetical protein